MKFPLCFALVNVFALISRLPGQTAMPGQEILASGWQLQEAGKVSEGGEQLSKASFAAGGWYPATVPGTVLTTLVDNGVYPEPLYGENNRPDKIPESLCRTDWWYRARVPVPAAYAGKRVWLNFAGINYAAQVWVNGQTVAVRTPRQRLRA